MTAQKLQQLSYLKAHIDSLKRDKKELLIKLNEADTATSSSYPNGVILKLDDYVLPSELSLDVIAFTLAKVDALIKSKEKVFAKL